MATHKTGSLVLTGNLTASAISASGGIIGDLTGTASYGVDNDWYLQGGTNDPTITGDIYHNYEHHRLTLTL